MKTLLPVFAFTFFASYGRAQSGGNYTLLPENLAYFTISRDKGNVNLQWQTVNEQNSRGFQVLRRTNGGWTAVAFVPTNAIGGNSTARVSYRYTDANGFRGISQYQVVETTNDNKQKASVIRSVRSDGQGIGVMAYPNPSATGKVNLLFEDSDMRDVAVCAIGGKVMRQYNGVTAYTLVIEGLAPGIYHIRTTVRSTNEVSVQRVLVNK